VQRSAIIALPLTAPYGASAQTIDSAASRLFDDVSSGVRSGADDMQCTLEARMAGKKPVSVTHHADTVEQAVAGAAEKLQKGSHPDGRAAAGH
jgi:hypothetical protein